jgi:hypothetical protein
MLHLRPTSRLAVQFDRGGFRFLNFKLAPLRFAKKGTVNLQPENFAAKT